MSNLSSFKLLSFDVYGTLIDWETGLLNAFQPVLKRTNKSDLDLKHLLKTIHTVQASEQKTSPGRKYPELLAIVHAKVCEELGIPDATKEENEAFGNSVGDFPAFPDTVSALKRLSKHYKLVVLSNVDNKSFERTNTSGLEGFKFDAVHTAEDIGSYKPDLKNFEYMLKKVKEDFGVEKNEVLQTAQSQFHDHHPAKEMGIKSCWVFRPGALVGNRDDPVYNWRFDKLADMADAVENEQEGQGK
jgi:2-haloalkanoic acid dehalogenase type II